MKMRGSVRQRLLGCCLLAFGVLAACGDDDDGGPPPPPPDLITFHSLNLQPEGLEYDESLGRFVVGSSTQGTIHTVDDDGNLALLVADPGLASTLGLHIDRDRDVLFAAGSTTQGGAGLGVYDLANGEVIRVVDIAAGTSAGPAQLANDVVVADSGAAWVTETLGSGVYAVDAAGTSSEFTTSPQLSLANGIELYNDEVLLIARIGGPLMRMRVGDPQSLEPVDTDQVVSGDGIVFTPQGDLAVVTIGGPASVLLLRSDDDWQTATTIGTWDSATITDTEPTTAAVRGDDVYVIFARLFDEANSRYDIERVVFE